MNKYRRMVIEALAPPFLATLIMAATDRSDTFLMLLAGFLPLLLFAYAFGIIPSVLYALAMECWFHSGLRARCGLLCTVGLSGLLGAGAGWLSALLGMSLGFFTKPDDSSLARIGLFVGLLIGFYVGRRQTPGAQPDAAPNCGPATQLGNSGASEGPPSVSFPLILPTACMRA